MNKSSPILVRPAQYRVTVHEDIEDVDPHVWDSLISPDDLQASHRFIRTCQASHIEDAVYRHVLLYQGVELSAVASFCRMTVNLDLLAPSAVRMATSAVRALRPSFLKVPVFFCGLPVSFGQSCMRFAVWADRAKALGAITGVMEELADDLNCRLLCLKEFGSTERAFLDPLTDNGYLLLPSLPFSRLTLRWKTFDHYVSDMRANYRRQIITDERRAQNHEIRVHHLVDFEADSARLYTLYEDVMDKAEFQLERLPPAFFRNITKNFGGRVRALLLEQNGEAAAAAVLLCGHETITFLLAGFDRRLNRKYHCYPFLLKEIIREAFRMGAKTLELGQTSYALKSRFGAYTVPRWLYLRHREDFSHKLLGMASGALFPAYQAPSRRVFKTAAPPVRP